ncbi:hypothetical protein M422DRAFT_263616 [Sphaerobolus stellatus SS14]|uniref:DUF6699 domain-containing protein n=1 Tax=Sphaerobolus stellatus (strain SS14) TaxID=990650 RepID=A0A0C9UYC9_SPHS4|nr:hypothetical protein M422DRAFT_263616 [Sphaerobolus stellatus SS14]
MPAKRSKGTPGRHNVPLESYSGYHAYAGLPPQPYPQYPPYPYPVYPQFFYPPPGPPSSNPKYYNALRDSPSPPPEKELHDLLANENKRDFYWDVRTSPVKKFQYRASGAVSYITDEVLEEEAMGPKSKGMRIVCDRYKWIFDVKRPETGSLTLKVILEGIFNGLHEPLTEAEWKELSSGEKRNAHISRGIRLAYDTTSFDVDSRMKRVDVIGERSMFSGLRLDDATEEWIMILSNRPTNQGRKS